MVELALSLMADVIAEALPIAIVIELSNILVKTFLRVAFGGKLWFGG